MALVPVSTSKDPFQEKLHDLSEELKLTKGYVDKEKGRWVGGKDVTRQEALIVRIANQIIEMLSQVFHKILNISVDHPLTAKEELSLAHVAKELQFAYSAANQKTQAAEMGKVVEEAKGRAKVIQAREQHKVDSLKRADELTKCAQVPRNNSLRGFPLLINNIWWTTDQAQLEAATIRVRVAHEEVHKYEGYPKLQKPCLQTLIEKKQALLKLLKPGTLEHFSLKREIDENTSQVEYMTAVAAAEDKVNALAKKVDQTPIGSHRLSFLKELLSAKIELQNLYTMNTPQHTQIKKEIRAIETEIESLKARLESLRAPKARAIKD